MISPPGGHAGVGEEPVRGRGVIPILGARSAGQFAENLRCVDVSLDEVQVRHLDEASRLEPEYPTRFLARENVRTSVSAGFADRLDVPSR
jgi:hypothetical protein